MKETMDIGWPRSLFWVANGFTGLGLKDTAVATGIWEANAAEERSGSSRRLSSRCPGEPSGL